MYHMNQFFMQPYTVFVWLPQNAEYLFKHSGGQYSALDMAQYVFWTGDEEGVAKAVEEFIRKGLVCISVSILIDQTQNFHTLCRNNLDVECTCFGFNVSIIYCFSIFSRLFFVCLFYLH